MTFIQKLVKTILPKKWADSIEAESRAWKLRCDNCGHTRSFWEAGGIRWKAAGRPKRYMYCPNDREYHWHTVYRNKSGGKGK